LSICDLVEIAKERCDRIDRALGGQAVVKRACVATRGVNFSD
jgi:hypothetical protein